MNATVSRQLARTGHPLVARSLAALLPLGLLIAAATHVSVAIEHWGTPFAVLSAGAAIAQGALAVAAFARPSGRVYQLSVLLSLVLMQLYALNITVGLPPFIAHAHDADTHVLFGLTLAEPHEVDAEGLIAQGAQLATVFSASLLDTPE
jgi:hypothetical protein